MPRPRPSMHAWQPPRQRTETPCRREQGNRPGGARGALDGRGARPRPSSDGHSSSCRIWTLQRYSFFDVSTLMPMPCRRSVRLKTASHAANSSPVRRQVRSVEHLHISKTQPALVRVVAELQRADWRQVFAAGCPAFCFSFFPPRLPLVAASHTHLLPFLSAKPPVPGPGRLKKGNHGDMPPHKRAAVLITRPSPAPPSSYGSS